MARRLSAAIENSERRRDEGVRQQQEQIGAEIRGRTERTNELGLGSRRKAASSNPIGTADRMQRVEGEGGEKPPAEVGGLADGRRCRRADPSASATSRAAASPASAAAISSPIMLPSKRHDRDDERSVGEGAVACVRSLCDSSPVT